MRVKKMVCGCNKMHCDTALQAGQDEEHACQGRLKEGHGQTRKHSRFIKLLRVKIVCGFNKMHCDTAGYRRAKMKNMLVKVGWKKGMVEKNGGSDSQALSSHQFDAREEDRLRLQQDAL